jgi:energy-converting hydrogenase A subunit M
MLDIHFYLPAKRKTSSSGWTSFNAPCCVHNGENPDKRSRGGIKLSDEGWSYHCFNCGYTASFVLGRNLSYKARRLLTWLNVPSEEIERINLESLKHKSIAGLLNERQQASNKVQDIRFEDRDIAIGQLLTEENTKELDYLRSRSVPMNYPYMRPMLPTGRDSIIIPFTYNHSIVGHCQRFLDDRTPKYINDIQPGYVFGTDLQNDAWKYVLVMEGVFDALSISGLAVLHAEINDAQVRLIRSLGKEIIVVPDQDTPGMKLVDRAVELGWSVSMPDWGDGVKDVNDAVIKYGSLGALLIIMQAREHSRIKIELRKKQIVKRANT